MICGSHLTVTKIAIEVNNSVPSSLEYKIIQFFFSQEMLATVNDNKNDTINVYNIETKMHSEQKMGKESPRQKKKSKNELI